MGIMVRVCRPAWICPSVICEMWPIVAIVVVGVHSCGWPSTIWLAAQAVIVAVGAWGCPSEMVETARTVVGACG